MFSDSCSTLAFLNEPFSFFFLRNIGLLSPGGINKIRDGEREKIRFDSRVRKSGLKRGRKEEGEMDPEFSWPESKHIAGQRASAQICVVSLCFTFNFLC